MTMLQFDQTGTSNEKVWSMAKRTWLRLSEAASRDDVPVTAETLRLMIMRGDVPSGYYDMRPYGKKHIYWIAEEILPSLDYKRVGKPPKD